MRKWDSSCIVPNSLLSHLPRSLSPNSLLREGISQDLNRVQHLQAGQVADLHPAAFAVGKNDLGFHTVDRLCEIFPNLLGNVVFLFLETEHPTQAATVRFDILNGEAGNELEDFKGRKTDAKGLEMAGSKIGSL